MEWRHGEQKPPSARTYQEVLISKWRYPLCEGLPTLQNIDICIIYIYHIYIYII